MRSKIRSQLEDLLAHYPKNQLANRVLKALQSRVSKLHQSTRALSTTYLVRIYTRRARWNSEKQLGIEGFDELITQLNQETESSLVIHAVSIDREVFSIFTDPAISKLVGILVSQKSLCHKRQKKLKVRFFGFFTAFVPFVAKFCRTRHRTIKRAQENKG